MRITANSQSGSLYLDHGKILKVRFLLGLCLPMPLHKCHPIPVHVLLRALAPCRTGLIQNTPHLVGCGPTVQGASHVRSQLRERGIAHHTSQGNELPFNDGQIRPSQH